MNAIIEKMEEVLEWGRNEEGCYMPDSFRDCADSQHI